MGIILFLLPFLAYAVYYYWDSIKIPKVGTPGTNGLNLVKGIGIVFFVFLVIWTAYEYTPDGYLAEAWAWEAGLKTPARLLFWFTLLCLIGLGVYSAFKGGHGAGADSSKGHGSNDSHDPHAGGGHGAHETNEKSLVRQFLNTILCLGIIFVFVVLGCFAWNHLNNKPGTAATIAKSANLTTPCYDVNLRQFANTGFRIVADDSIRYSIPGVPGTFVYRPGDENKTTTTPPARIKSLADMNYSFWAAGSNKDKKISFKLIP